MKGLRAAVAAALLLSSHQPAAAQADLLLGIMGGMIQEGVRQQQRQEQINRERAVRAQEQARQRAVEIARVKRIQTALATLGFYTRAIDGDFGPGTRAAVLAYRRSFGYPGGEGFADAEIRHLEWIASAGFRDGNELRRAEAGGFGSRAELLAAERGGFRDARSLEAARRAGLETFADYERFRASGFSDARQYRDARDAGFADRRSFDAARRAGFDTAEEYGAFVASGLPDRNAFLAERTRRERAETAGKACLAAVEEQDWTAAAPACAQAAAASPGDGTLVAASTRAARSLEAQEIAERAEVARIEAEIARVREEGEPSPQKSQRLAALAREAAEVETRLSRAGQARAVSSCLSESEASRWGEALAACRVALAAIPDDADLAARVETAQTRLDDERRTAETERARIALEAARREASETIDALEAFTGAGGTLERGLEVARAVVALKRLEASSTAEPVEQARRALETLLAEERAYNAFLALSESAARSARAAAVAEATGNARRLEAFARAFLARNVLSPEAPDLIALQGRLAQALAGDDPDAIVLAQEEATRTLARLGLEGQARAFRIEPDVDAETLRAEAGAEEAARLALAGARERTRAAIDDIEAYAGEGGRFEQSLAVARAIAALRRVEDTDDASQLELARSDLEETLAAEERFSAFRQRRESARRAARNDGSVTAVARARLMDSFIEDHLAADPLSPAILDLLALHERLGVAIGGGAPAEIAATLAEGESMLARLGLADALATFAERARNREAPGPARVADNGLAVTALNAALLDGDPRDVLILQNVSGRAPHMTRNLVGRAVFAEDAAEICFAHAVPDRTLPVKRALARIRTEGARVLRGGRRCAPESLMGNDMIVVSRSAFLAENPLYAQALLQPFEAGRLGVLDVIAWDAVAQDAARDDALIARLAVEIEAGAREGFGFVAMADGAHRLCIVEAEPDGNVRALHAHLLEALSEPLDMHLPTLADVRFEDRERVYARAQRGECGAILADARDLHGFLKALARDGIAHALAPIWIEPETIEEGRRALAEASETRLRELAALSQEAEAQEALRRELAGTAERRRLEREARLRALYGAEARAALEDLRKYAGASVHTMGGDEPAAELFPELARYLRAHASDTWEVTAHSVDLLDFGTGNWGERRIEGILGMLTVESRNRTLGRYRTSCFVIGYLLDAEFDRRRDGIEIGCAGADATVTAWRTGRGFDSRWVAALDE